MRTTLDIPENLINEAMRLTNSKNKTELIKEALENIIRMYKIKELKTYKGKVPLNIDLNIIRERNVRPY